MLVKAIFLIIFSKWKVCYESYKGHLVIAFITFNLGVAAWVVFRHSSMKVASKTRLVSPAIPVENRALKDEQVDSQTTANFSSELLFIKKAKTEQADFYRIEASYPQLANTNIKSAQKFNDMIEQIVTIEITDYLRYKKAEARKDKYASHILGSMDIYCQIIFSTSRIISIRFLVSRNSERQLHSDDYYFSINYELEKDELVELSSLFKKRANYLKAISHYCVNQLSKDYWAADEWMRDGTAPKIENFSTWNITPAGILISFESYQVGVGGMGKPEVIVPYSVLRRYLIKKSIVSPFI